MQISEERSLIWVFNEFGSDLFSSEAIEPNSALIEFSIGQVPTSRWRHLKMNIVTKEILQALCVSEWLAGQMAPASLIFFASGYQISHQLKSMSFQCPKTGRRLKVCIKMFKKWMYLAKFPSFLRQKQYIIVQNIIVIKAEEFVTSCAKSPIPYVFPCGQNLFGLCPMK